MTEGKKFVLGVVSMVGTGAVSLFVGLSVNVHNWSLTRSERLASEKFQATQIQQVHDAAISLTNTIDKHAGISEKHSVAIDSLQNSVDAVKGELQKIPEVKDGVASSRLGNPSPGIQRPALSRSEHRTQFENLPKSGVKFAQTIPKSLIPPSSNRLITPKTQPVIIRSSPRIVRLEHRIERRDDRHDFQLAERHWR